MAAASVVDDANDLPPAALSDTCSLTRTVHAVLGFSFGADNATALSSLILSFFFSSGVKTFFGLLLAFGLAVTFFGFLDAFFLVAALLLGFGDVAWALVAVANVRRDVKQMLAPDNVASVFSRVCEYQMLWSTRFVDERTAPAPTLLTAARAIVDSMMVKGVHRLCTLVGVLERDFGSNGRRTTTDVDCTK